MTEWTPETDTHTLHFWIGMFAGPMVVSMRTYEAWREAAAVAAEREGQPDLAGEIRQANSEQIVGMWDRVQNKERWNRE